MTEIGGYLKSISNCAGAFLRKIHKSKVNLKTIKSWLSFRQTY